MAPEWLLVNHISVYFLSPKSLVLFVVLKLMIGSQLVGCLKRRQNVGNFATDAGRFSTISRYNTTKVELIN